MGAFAAVVYSMDGLGHWESDAQSSALANTGLSTLAGTSWQQFPSWWSGMEPSTADVYYKMRDTSGVCEERPMCQPIGAEFGLVCSCSMTPNVQVPSSAQCDNESKQQEREEQGVQSRIDAEPDVSDKFRCSLSHSSNWKNTFVHLMAPLATMHGAQRRSRSVPKDFGSSKADWNTTYQAFRFVRASRPEQQSSAKMSICKVSSGAPETHVTFDQFATEFHRHAEEKPPSSNRRCDRGWKGHEAQRQRRSRPVACRADKWWQGRRCDTWQSAVAPSAAENGAWEEDNCWSSRGDVGHQSGSWDGWQQEGDWRMRRTPRSWW